MRHPIDKLPPSPRIRKGRHLELEVGVLVFYPYGVLIPGRSQQSMKIQRAGGWFIPLGVAMVVLGGLVVWLALGLPVPQRYPVIVMGVVIILFGAGFALVRLHVEINRGAGRVIRAWGLLAPFVRNSFSLDTFREVCIGAYIFSSSGPGVSIKYVVYLKGSEETIILLKSRSLVRARDLAQGVAVYTGLPVVDHLQ